MLRAAGHRGWCVIGVILSGWDIEGKKVLKQFEGYIQSSFRSY